MQAKARIVKIGNSRGIRIAKTLLDEASLPDEVEVHAQPGRLPGDRRDQVLSRQLHLRHVPTQRNRRKSSREIMRSYTILRALIIARGSTIECTQDRGAMSECAGVCDNQCATARKLLILKTERCPSG
jgi:hypothetical protein